MQRAAGDGVVIAELEYGIRFLTAGVPTLYNTTFQNGRSGGESR